MKHRCPQCSGSKKITLVLSLVQACRVQIPCVYCSGTGYLSQTQKEQIERENDRWCCCDTPGAATSFTDGDDIIVKHHQCCGNCGKITFIG